MLIVSNDNLIINMLEVLYLANWKANQKETAQDDLVLFYAIKDEVLYLFHKNMFPSTRVKYVKIPFLKRCLQCKKKADTLHEIDPHRSWGYHLNMLPTCPNDIAIPEKATIEMVVRIQGRMFSLHIPLVKTSAWGIDIDDLHERKWTPKNDFLYTDVNLEDTRTLNDLMIVLIECVFEVMRGSDNDDLKHVSEIIKTKQTRLQVLEKKEAYYGINCPAEIIVEIDQLRQEIVNLKQKTL